LSEIPPAAIQKAKAKGYQGRMIANIESSIEGAPGFHAALQTSIKGSAGFHPILQGPSMVLSLQVCTMVPGLQGPTNGAQVCGASLWIIVSRVSL
ncbi:hypothetical protein GOODEAATRI_017388, partial [Goodea atripinnis]